MEFRWLRNPSFSIQFSIDIIIIKCAECLTKIKLAFKVNYNESMEDDKLWVFISS